MRNRQLFRGLYKIVKVNVSDPNMQEIMNDKVNDLVKGTSTHVPTVKAKLLARYGVKDLDEAMVKIVGEINYLYNPYSTPEEKWIDLQANYLEYSFNNCKVREILNTMEKISRFEGFNTEKLCHLDDKLLKKQQQLGEAVDKYRIDVFNLGHKVFNVGQRERLQTNFEERWHHLKGLLDDKQKELEKIEELLCRINEVDREIRFRKGMALRLNFREQKEFEKSRKGSWRSLDYRQDRF